MDEIERPTLPRAWPSIAAGLAALAGMNSCARAMIPLSMFAAPVVGVIVAAALFAILLALRPAAEREAEQRQRVRIAAAVAWLVCIGACWRFATHVRGGLSGESRIYGGPAVMASLVVGAVLGSIISTLVQRIGMAQYYRQAAAPPDSSPSIARRLGIGR
jgi:hypothetical protein